MNQCKKWQVIEVCIAWRYQSWRYFLCPFWWWLTWEPPPMLKMMCSFYRLMLCLPGRNVFQVGDFMQPHWARLQFGQSCRSCLHRRSVRNSGASACGDGTYDSNYACKNGVFMQMGTRKHACWRRTTVSPQILPLFFKPLHISDFCSKDYFKCCKVLSQYVHKKTKISARPHENRQYKIHCCRILSAVNVLSSIVRTNTYIVSIYSLLYSFSDI